MAKGCVRRYTTDRARFADSLEVIKFICKEFWSEVFKKQVDNLKTNRHRVRVGARLVCTTALRLSGDTAGSVMWVLPGAERYTLLCN